MEDRHAGDELSPTLEAHVRRHLGLLRHARRRHGLAPGDLDELVQEVRLRLWRAQHTRENVAQVSASYMYRTAMSAAVDLIRRRRRESQTLSLSPESEALVDRQHAAPSADPAEALDVARLLEQAINELPPARGVAVRLHLAGYPRDEIGSLMGWTEAKARNLIYRGLSDLRIRLAELGVGPEGVR